MNKSIIRTIEKAYGCQVSGAKQRRKVYVLRTDKGIWVLKGYRQREKAEQVTQLADYLHEQGFFRTVQYIGTVQGSKVCKIGNRHFTMMKAIDGREASNANPYDMKQALMTLARFHLAARGYPHHHELNPYQPPLLDKWERRLSHFEEIAENIRTRGAQNRLEEIIRSMADEVLEDGQTVLQQVHKLPLYAEMQAAITQRTLAHRDVASHNFLLTPSGHCYLIDLDTVAPDMQLADLVQFFSRMLVLQGYSLDAFLDGIDAYCKVLPLSDVQIWVIHQLLRYPDNFLREVTGVYEQRPGYQARHVLQLLMLEWRNRATRRRFLEAETEIWRHSPWGAYHVVG